MIRITTLLWIALLVVAGGTVMHVSYQVRRVDRHLAELDSKTRQEQEAIRILGAEWDSLNDPKRIDALSKRYLALESTPIQRVVRLEDIPLKPSAEQLVKLDAAAAKMAKDHPAPRTPISPARPSAPEIQVAAHQSTPTPTLSGIGLILARAERHE
jgi:cell division protein FtsL